MYKGSITIRGASASMINARCSTRELSVYLGWAGMVSHSTK